MKQLTSLLAISIILIYANCTPKNTHNTTSDIFHFPTIINSQELDSAKKAFHSSEEMQGVFPRFVGKYKFNSIVDINPEIRDTTLYKDKITRYSAGLDTLDINGFELIVDYDTEVYFDRYKLQETFAYYPVYFVNSTKSDKLFLGKDSHAFGIQEAYDKANYNGWRPIEKKGFDFCGNGHWALRVRPNEFIVLLMAKYKGDYETNMRTRISVGSSIYVSRPFMGSINKSQFESQDSSFVEGLVTNPNSSMRYFYGANYIVNEENPDDGDDYSVKTY